MSFPVIPPVFDHMSSVVIAEYAADGRLLRGNAGFRRLYPADRDMSWYVFTQPRLDELLHAAPTAEGVAYEGLLTLGDADGEMRTVCGSVYVEDGRLLVVAGYNIDEFEASLKLLLDLNNQIDIAQRELAHSNRELARKEKVIRALSMTDALTGIGNRRQLDESLESEAARSQRYGTPFSLALLDLDHFKRVNDTFGHQQGDAVLRAAGALLKQLLRQSDSAARLGGEEFVVLMPGAGLAEAVACAERLRSEMAALRLPDLPPVTVSIGVAEIVRGESGDRLLARADAALYAAKQGGRNRVVVAEAESGSAG